MSKFTPVHLPDDRQLNGRVSQTMLRHFDGCPRSGYLYALTRGEVRTPEMLRGTALHLIAERATKAAMEQGEPIIPAELVKAIADEVLAEVHVPSGEWDYLRECAWRLGSELAIDPGAVVACETLFVLRVGDYDVRCRIDFAQLTEDGAAVLVRDYKSGRGAMSNEEIARVRPDGTLHAKSFQLLLYAIVLAFGVPVREERCGMCVANDPGIGTDGCPGCGGRGVVEVPEPFPVASRAQRFDLEYVFPGIEDKEGKMLRRPVSLTRLEVTEYKTALEGLLARLAVAERTGDWPAVVSDGACSQCPAASLCPIPAELRDHRGTVNSLEEASEAAEVLYREKSEHAARHKELREFAKARGVAIPFGDGMAMDFVFSESERIADRDAMWSDMERAVQYGEPFDRAAHVKKVKSTTFKAVQVDREEAGTVAGD